MRSKKISRLWHRFLEWYYEPSAYVRLRRRVEDLQRRERRLNKRSRELGQLEREIDAQRAAFTQATQDVYHTLDLCQRIQKRLDTLDDGYGALLGIDGP